jgi:hypothetical protein
MPLETDTNSILGIQDFSETVHVANNNSSLGSVSTSKYDIDSNSDNHTTLSNMNELEQEIPNLHDRTDDKSNSMEIISELPPHTHDTSTEPLLEGGARKDNPLLDKTKKINSEIDTSITADIDADIDADINNTDINDNIHEIDYLVPEDKDLINLVLVSSTVERYINNFNSEEMKKYKHTFKNLYQKYSNKRYIIHNINNVITVMKNDKKRDTIMELKKPVYLYYDSDKHSDGDNLGILKREISNKRAELQFLYQSLVNKLNVDLDEKKQFEKQRKKFIELLEKYYIRTLYHQKINNINTTNKINITIQDILGDGKILQGNIYSIDKSLIDEINTYNTDKLNSYNTLISRIQATNKHQSKEITNLIKEYIDNKNMLELQNKVKSSVKLQDNYINYIITELPREL